MENTWKGVGGCGGGGGVWRRGWVPGGGRVEGGGGNKTLSRISSKNKHFHKKKLIFMVPFSGTTCNRASMICFNLGAGC